MDEKLLRALPARPADQAIQETSDEKVWQSPGHAVVDTALEVTAYALTDR
ncbi:pyrroloquinoline quinone precursor peptide PqqA [Streptomyces chartreusis]